MSSLAQFPSDFKPLVIVTGDRREIPPQSKGDLLAYSVSSTDVMFMNHLKLGDCLVVSDKQFVIDSDQDLHSRFGKTNILVVGSPAVNLLARRINDQSPFRFSISEQTRKDLEDQNRLINKFELDEDGLYVYYQCLEGTLDPKTILSRHSELDPKLRDFHDKAQEIVNAFKGTRLFSDLKQNQRPIRYLMHKLDKPGIYDSVSNMVRGESTSLHKDYGLISLLPNPFANEPGYWVVYVAGVHGPGTAGGMRLLTDKNALTGHPCGGVYEVLLDRFTNYFEKLSKARVRWETPPYDVKEVPGEYLMTTKRLQVFISSPKKDKDQAQIEFNESLKENLKSICKQRGISLYIEDPYTLKMGGRLSFWDKILHYERDCDFVIHDMTGCAKGVMVEVGFSVGIRKQIFLLWNMRKSPVTAFEEMRIPKLLPVTHIEKIDLSDKPAANKILSHKILDCAIGKDHFFDCRSCDDLPKNDQDKVGFIYSHNQQLKRYLEKSLREHGIRIVQEPESPKGLRICKICQVLQVADFAFVHVENEDPDGFIVLGLSKALEKKTLMLTLSRYEKNAFAWEPQVIKFNIEDIEGSLSVEVSKFLEY